MIVAPLALAAGLDIGHVVDNGTIHDNHALVDSTGVGWVRINLRLDTQNAVDDAWFATYDQVIDNYLARGIEVYALINDEALGSAHPHGSDAWIADYVATAVQIVDHFKNRVRVYEIINEPNDYAGGSTSRFTPAQFAKILQDTYLAVKHDAGHDADACWQVTLVSGPLFSFDNSPSDAYLDQTYSIGKSQLAWDYTHQVTGSYPLDGIGYHMYVAQGLDSANADVRTQTLANLSAVDAVVTKYETSKPFWVSEYGWETAVVGADVQAQRLTAGYAAMAESLKVATAFYFTFQDFPGATYGVYDDQLVRRPSADTLVLIAGVPRRSRIDAITPPTSIAPGALGEIAVTLTNRGQSPWTPDVYRLAAGGGCPDSAVANAIAWEPAMGYANSLIDARLFLADTISPGQSVTVRVPIRAPQQEGDYAFAARMVEEGVTLFGPTIHATIHVTATPVGPDGVATTEPSGCGCASSGSGRGSLAVFALVAGSLRRRRGLSGSRARR